MVAFAGDLAVEVSATRELELQKNAKNTIQLLRKELDKMALTLNFKKTDAVLLSGRRKLPELEVKISENFSFETHRQIKDFRMTAHVDHVASHSEEKLLF